MASPLAARLRQLQRDAGATRSGPAAVDGLAERIARLRRRPDRREELASRLRGDWVADGVLRVRGEAPLNQWDIESCRVLGVEAERRHELRFIDTETTGLAGGTGTTVFLFGWASVDAGRIRVEQWVLARPGAEAAFWDAIDEAFGARFTLVSFNGKSFDWPLVATRRRLAGRNRSDADHHVDLLHPVRRAFGRSWPDCRLTTCEERLLGHSRRNDLSGEFAPWAYREFLAGRTVDPLCRIVEHHHQDVVSLVHLLPLVARAQLSPGAVGADVAAVGRHWLGAGDTERALAALGDDPGREVARVRAEAYRKLGRWDEAVEQWEALADSDDPQALEALAKYHEHRRKDFEGALALGRRLVAIDPNESRHRHRLARLERRAAVARQGA